MDRQCCRFLTRIRCESVPVNQSLSTTPGLHSVIWFRKSHRNGAGSLCWSVPSNWRPCLGVLVSPVLAAHSDSYFPRTSWCSKLTLGRDLFPPGFQLLRPTKVKCPNYDLANSNEEAAIAAQVNSQYGQMFKWLQNTTGMDSIDFWNINDLYDIQREVNKFTDSDPYSFPQIDHNMPQPKWLNQVFNGTTIMDHVRELKRITRNQEFNSATKAKFRGGMLVNQFLKNMEDLNSNSSTLNAYLYSSVRLPLIQSMITIFSTMELSPPFSMHWTSRMTNSSLTQLQ